jgi:hypothetical protein
VPAESWGWPKNDEELVELQYRLAAAAAQTRAAQPFLASGHRAFFDGCFIAYARAGPGPGQSGDRA